VQLPDVTFRRLCEARDLLAQVREDSISIKAVAQQVHISPFHFIRQFEALFGQTPHQFRMQSRLDYAKQLLAIDQMPVTDVCMEIGLSSLGSFSDFFTRRVGLAPSDYQRRARVMVEVPHNYPVELFPGCLTLMGHLPVDAFRNSVFRNFGEANIPNVP
jgi:AraC-like DNA-binding protein